MIKESLVVMALVGCDCDAKTCDYIRTAETGWATKAECEADIGRRIVTQHENYPLVIAVCRDGGEGATVASNTSAPAEAATEQVRLAVGDLSAVPRADDVSHDALGRITTLFRTVDGYVSVREKAGSLASASRQARDTLTRLASSVTPDWF